MRLVVGEHFDKAADEIENAKMKTFKKVPHLNRPRRATLSADEILKRMESFPERAEEFRASALAQETELRQRSPSKKVKSLSNRKVRLLGTTRKSKS